MAPGRDRSATIGFRCVKDTPASTSGGVLAGANSQPASTINLTAEGTIDWVHWGASSPSSFDHKYNVASQIQGFTVIGNDTVKQYSNNPNGYSWTDGSPTTSATNTTSGIYLVGLNNGFQLTFPADTTQRTLHLYVGVWKAQGQLQATLSDGTSVTYSDTSLDNASGTSNKVYTFNYKTPTVGQVLTVTFTVAQQYDSYGNVTLQAATVSQDNSETAPPGNVNLTNEGTTDWAHWGSSTGSSFDHKSGVTQQINYSVIGGSASQYANNPNTFTWSDGTPTANANATATGIFISGLNNGFQVTVPASTTPHTLRLYVGVWNAQGKLQANMSDGSRATYTDTSLGNSTGTTNGMYTLIYQAGSDGQTLTIRFILSNDYYGYGNATLQSATLQ